MAAAAAAGALLATAGASLAGAEPWPQFGADSGRSGNQTADVGTLPARAIYPGGRAFDSDPAVTSTIITAASNAQAQRVAYGYYVPGPNSTVNGTIRLRRLVQGTSTAAVTVDDDTPNDSSAQPHSDPDTFGPTNGSGAGVTPVDAGGELYVIHNDDNNPVPAPGVNSGSNDIAFAQINVATGQKVQDVAIGRNSPDVTPGMGETSGYTIRSSPVLRTNNEGNRELFFIATNGTDERLFRLVINNATDPAAADTISSVTRSADLNANPDASPTIARFLDPATQLAVSYVIVPMQTGFTTIRTDSTDLSSRGPEAPLLESGAAIGYTASLPAGLGANELTPHFYALTRQTQNTFVYKLAQGAGSQAARQGFVQVGGAAGKSSQLAGIPAPALAVAERNGTSGGRVIVATENNVYSLDAANLAANPGKLADPGLSAPNGFTKTVPAVQGALGFIASDTGVQYAFTVADAKEVPKGAAGFDLPQVSLNATSAIGQPAIAEGIVTIATNNGVYGYGLEETPSVAPTGAFDAPASNATVSGSSVPIAVRATDDHAVQQVVFKRGDTVIGTDTTPESDNQTYNTTFNTTGLPEGPTVITAVITDVSGNETTINRTVIVDNLADPTPAFTFTPSSPQPTGTEFTFDAKDSKSNAQNAGALTYEWDFGDGGKATGQQAKHVFSEPGRFTVTLTVRDNGGPASTSKTVEITNRAPVAAFQISPSPAATGQTVTFDASSSSDPDGSIVRYEWDLDGNGSFEVSNAGNQKSTERRYDVPGTYTIGLRVTDDRNGTATTTAQLVVNNASGTPGNDNPTASFTANPNPGLAGKAIAFDASASRDPDGSIAKYEWDLDGNGTFETDTGNNPKTSRTYTVPEVVNVRLKVTDNGGASAAAVKQVIVTADDPTTKCGGNAPRCSARISYSVSPKTDTRAPFRFRVKGRLRPPSGLDRGDACQGRVTMQIKRGKRTVSNTRRQVRTNCRFTLVKTFRNASRFRAAKTLRVTVTFQGNKVLNPNKGKTLPVRVR